MLRKWLFVFALMCSSNFIVPHSALRDFDGCCVEDFDLGQDACDDNKHEVQQNQSLADQLSQKLQCTAVMCVLKYYEAKSWCSQMFARALYKWAQFRHHISFASIACKRHLQEREEKPR